MQVPVPVSQEDKEIVMRVLATSVLSGLALSLLAACGTVPINASPQAGADLQPLTTAQSTFSTKFYGGFGGYGLGLGGCGLGGFGGYGLGGCGLGGFGGYGLGLGGCGFGGFGLGLGGCGLGGWGLGFGGCGLGGFGLGYPYAAGLGYGSLYRGLFW
jgi:hypothetical protein